MQGSLPSEHPLDPGLLGVLAVDGERERAAAWAQRLGAPLLSAAPQAAGVVLRAGRPPALQATGPGAPRHPLAVDFTDPAWRRRLAGTSARRDPLARAVGLHRRSAPAVVDATAGLGRDAAVLAHLGAHVVALEASPVLAALLAEALAGGREAPEPAVALERLSLRCGDLRRLLPALPEACREVVYLDPMFPAGSTRGGVGREAQILRALLPAEAQAPEAELLEHARAAATRRVVVKRSRRAPALAAQAPTRSLHGRAVRFDLYEP